MSAPISHMSGLPNAEMNGDSTIMKIGMARVDAVQMSRNSDGFSLRSARAMSRARLAPKSRCSTTRLRLASASLWAMSRAIAGLSCRPDHVLVDGNMLPPDLPCAAEAIVDGDALSVSIAAASIIAKVTRDRLMQRLGNAYPAYGFERHMGYSTPEHFAALRQHGPCPHHRQSFAPVREQQLLLEI